MEKRIERIKAEIAELVEDLEDAYMDEGLNLSIASGKVLRDLGEAERKARKAARAAERAARTEAQTAERAAAEAERAARRAERAAYDAKQAKKRAVLKALRERRRESEGNAQGDA